MADKKTEKKGTVTVAENKAKALEMALQQIEKTYGKGAVMRLGENV
ncbi:MAG: DNA recombination/repair protein RecA, partial [Clostridia bacterium]|nr:DNA recombination/repair protein RecA [Clostridia bacterium]